MYIYIYIFFFWCAQIPWDAMPFVSLIKLIVFGTLQPTALLTLSGYNNFIHVIAFTVQFH